MTICATGQTCGKVSPMARSEERRAEALATVVACGGNISEAARRCGIPRRTIQTWKDAAHPDVVKEAAKVAIVAKAKEMAKDAAEEAIARIVLDEGCERLARRCLVATELPGKVEKASLRDLTWTAGVMIDKMRLLREQAPPPTQAEMRMTEAIEAAARAIVDLAAQGGRVISIEEASRQVRAVQIKQSELTLTVIEASK